jgi:integrase
MATYRKLKSGNWQARVSKDGKEFSVGTFRTKQEAKIAAAKVEERIYYGHTLTDREMMFDEVANEWLHEHKKLTLKESTFKQVEVVVRLHILPYFGNRKIMGIKRPEIKRWLNKYAEVKNKNGDDKYAYGSRLRYLSVLKGIFHYATHDLEILEKDPTQKLKIPVKDKIHINKDIKYYSLNELNKLLAFMENYNHRRFKEYQLYYILILLLSKTGLRISEALALRWTDITGNKIRIERQTSRDDNNNLTLTSLKNTSSYRTIRIDEVLVTALNDFKKDQYQVILKYKTFKKNTDGIIFQNFLGNYLTPSTVRDSIQEYCLKAGVEYKATHVFRHTHAVLSLEAGASIKYVSKRLGHASIKVTADDYLDITEKIEEDELTKFAEYTKR